MVVSNIEPMTSGKLGPSAEFEAGRFGLADVHRKIQQTIHYMGTHLSEATQVNRLAAMVNVSPSHFYALFKQHTGYAPIDFFIRLRMRRASEILETTSLSVKEVAGMLGYEDQFYFSRLFKAVHGIPPRDYRARKQPSDHQDLKLNQPNQKNAARCPRLVPAGEIQISEPMLMGRFEPDALRPEKFPRRYRKFSSQSGQSCSVSVQPCATNNPPIK